MWKKRNINMTAIGVGQILKGQNLPAGTAVKSIFGQSFLTEFKPCALISENLFEFYLPIDAVCIMRGLAEHHFHNILPWPLTSLSLIMTEVIY